MDLQVPSFDWSTTRSTSAREVSYKLTEGAGWNHYTTATWSPAFPKHRARTNRMPCRGMTHNEQTSPDICPDNKTGLHQHSSHKNFLVVNSRTTDGQSQYPSICAHNTFECHLADNTKLSPPCTAALTSAILLTTPNHRTALHSSF